MRYTRRAFLSAAGVASVVGAGCTTTTDGGSGGTDATTTRSNEDGTASAETGTPTSSRTPSETPTETATETSTTTAGASDLDPSVTEASLLLNWKPSGLHLPYYTAKAKGFYEEAGLTVTDIVAGQGSDFSAKQAGLGKSTFAITSADQVINVNSRGLSPLSVGVVMQRSPVVLFTVRENFGEAFSSVEQLAGRTLGSGPGMVRILAELMLERAGIREDVTIVDTGYDTVQQLLAGKVDAAAGVFGDAIAARAQGHTTDSVPVAEQVPSYGHVVATESSFAAENPDTVRAFLRGTARGAAWAHRNPGAATDLLVESNQALSETRDRQKQKWTRMASGFMLSEAVEKRGWGWSVGEPWQVLRQALDDADLLGDGSVEPSSVWTNDYLDADYRYIGSYAEVVEE